MTMRAEADVPRPEAGARFTAQQPGQESGASWAGQAGGGSDAPPSPGAHDGDHGGRAAAPGDPSPAQKPSTGQDRSPLSWRAAREIARTSVSSPLPPIRVVLAGALAHVLAEPLVARTDLPAFDTSAMDGWAVAGPGPWRLREGRVLAGQTASGTLDDGVAVSIATGAQLPRGATAVVRREDGRPLVGFLRTARPPGPGQDVRPRGQECRTGDELLPAGCPVSPAVLGLAAAAGYDDLQVIARPTAEVFVLGDELLRSGPPREGRVRDALGPLLPPWLTALGADVLGTHRIADDAEALHQAVAQSRADLVVTTGGTALGPVDFVHLVLARLPARMLVDGVAVRPGHPMLLAQRPGDGGYLVGLPGNPLAAVSAMVTLAAPVLASLSGRAAPEPLHRPMSTAVRGHPHDTRLVPVTVDGEAKPLHFQGPAMLRGLAAADGLAVIPPGGVERAMTVEILKIDW